MNTAALAAIVAVAALAVALLVAWYYRRKQKTSRTFEGTLTFGWEVSAFVPGRPGSTTPRYWVAWTPESRLMETLKEHGFDPAWTSGYATVRTRFVGTLETRAEGGYGHMGQYAGQLMVEKVLSMARTEPRS